MPMVDSAYGKALGLKAPWRPIGGLLGACHITRRPKPGLVNHCEQEDSGGSFRYSVA